jgi:hypothetical protein
MIAGDTNETAEFGNHHQISGRYSAPAASGALFTGLTQGTPMPKKTTTQPAATAAPILATAPSPMPNAQFQDAIDAFKAFKPNTTRWSEFNALALAHDPFRDSELRLQ